MALSDLNGDSHVDIVTTNQGYNSLSVLLNNGDGTFVPPVTYVAAGDARSAALADRSRPGWQGLGAAGDAHSAALADLNGDGHVDIVVAKAGVSVLLGIGDGTFGAAETYVVEGSPYSVAVSDLNGDSHVDIVTGSGSVLLGNGDGTFAAGAAFASGGWGCVVGLSDVNADSHVDIVMANSGTDNVLVFLGIGDGTFAPHGSYAVGYWPWSVALADLNGDGNVDIMTANTSADVSVLLGIGDGTFATQATYAVGHGPRSVSPADLNGDGHMDIVTADYDNDNVSVLLGLGGPTTFVVDSFYDAPDANPGDGLAEDGSGNTTLRAAIMEANAQPGHNGIVLPPGTYTLSIAGTREDGAATGDLDVADTSGSLTIIGAGADATRIDGNGLDRAFHVLAGVTLDLCGVTITQGSASSGGGILSEGIVAMSSSVVSHNSASEGAGICVSDGAFTVTGSTISDNSAGQSGGGIAGFSVLTVTNSTISGNSAGGTGGGIRNEGTLTVANSTLFGNSAGSDGGGIGSSASGTVDIKNTIVAGNNGASGPDVLGTVASQGFNLVGDGSGSAGWLPNDLVGTSGSPIDPLVGPLQDNGGPTFTHGLLGGSPAVDAGNTIGAPAPDQRGVGRPRDGDGDGTAAVDIGAFEVVSIFVVNSFDDTVDTDPGDGVAQDASGNTTLRAAVMEANALAGDDTIDVPAGTYTLSIAGIIEAAAATGDLDITDTTGTLTITGAGAALTTIDAAGLDRVFHVLRRAHLNLSGVTVTAGNATGDYGGGIYNSGTVTITDTTITGNSADIDGGGIYNSGTVTIADSTITGNSADIDGGGIRNTGTATLSNCTLSYNLASDYGAGIANAGTLTITGSTISANSAADFGGGIYNFGADAALTIANSTISANSAADYGGGIYNSRGEVTITDGIISGNSARYGGGIRNYTSGKMTITNSTVSGNSADIYGGGIRNAGTLTLRNSTLSHNVAGDDGGGICNDGSSSSLTVTNSTISANSAINRGGGIYNSCTVNGKNTIIAGNVANSNGPDVYGDLDSQGHNLIGDDTGSSGWLPSDLLNVDPLLSPLRDNGGPTPTHALLWGSPAIDAGDNLGVPGTDQRGMPRIVDGDGDGTATVDIGAFELAEPVYVYATDDDDAITFQTDGTTHVVTVNGEDQTVDASLVLVIDGLGGNDSLRVYGTSRDETAILQPSAVDFLGPGYHVHGTSVEVVRVYAAEGTDDAYLTGSAGDEDTFCGKEAYSYLQGTGFTNLVYGFDYVEAQGGSDRAYLYDSPGDDTFFGDPDSGRMELESGVVNKAIGFDIVKAYADQNGNDTATLTGSDGDERFYSYETYGYLNGPGFFNYAAGFDYLEANVTTGGATSRDQAWLFDSPGDDTLYADPTAARMDRGTTGTDDAVATGFDVVRGYASGAADHDEAYLTGSAGDDRFASYETYSYLKDAAGTAFCNVLRQFDYVEASAAGQTTVDRAYLYDSRGSDVFHGDEGSSRMDRGTTGTDDVKALGFEVVKANSSRGIDEAYLTGSSADDRFFSYLTYSYMQGGTGFHNLAFGFAYVQADVGGTAGDFDRGYLYDSPRNDLFTGGTTYGEMISVGRWVTANDFDIGWAVSGPGDNDTATMWLGTAWRLAGDWENVIPYSSPGGAGLPGADLDFARWIAALEDAEAMGGNGGEAEEVDLLSLDHLFTLYGGR